ncbi:hypothetical protein N2152v2_002507 [Parachlorella kessleri]
MAAKVPAFTDLGATAKEVLYGARGTGVFQFNKVVGVSSTTADGVTFAVTALQRDNALDMALKTTYTAPKYSLIGTISQAGKLGLAATYKELAPGLTLGLSGTLPDLDSANLAVDYSIPHVTLRSAVSLTAAPKVNLAATTGYDNFTLGAEAAYDAAKGALTKWNAGVGYSAADFQAAVFLNDLNVVTGQYAHSVTATATVGAEVAHNLTSKVTTFSAGVAKRLEAGTLVKGKLEDNGHVSVLYEQEVRPKTKMGLSAQFDALNLDKAPKFGFAYDLKY